MTDFPVACGWAETGSNSDALRLDAETDYLRASVFGNRAFATIVEMRDFGDTIVATWEDDLVEQFVIQAMPTTRTTIYTVPAERSAIIRHIEMVNDTVDPKTVNVWLNDIKLESDQEIPAHQAFDRDGIWVLEAGQEVEVQASAAGCNIFVSGVAEVAEA
jgi:hypothetical protein